LIWEYAYVAEELIQDKFVNDSLSNFHSTQRFLGKDLWKEIQAGKRVEMEKKVHA
jgi:hypothetical protein